MSKILRLRSNIPPTSDGNIGIFISLLMLILLSAATPYAAAQSTTDSPEYGYGGGQINPSISVVIAVLVSAFLLMVCFAIYIRNCTDDDGSSTASRFAAASAGRYRGSSLGLDASVIELFPIIAYSAVKDHKIGKGALECAVCLNEFTDEESLRLLSKCDHVFHPECIDAWLASHTTCPVCRDDLKISSREIPGDTETRGELNDSLEEQNPTSERCETPDQISINVDDGGGDSEEVETAKKSEIPKKSRQVAEKLPRSHSTGHSLVRPGENRERYTLRLPEGVRRQIISQRLNRTTSCIIVLPREASSRRGYRSSGEDSSHGRSDRLVFFMRSGSVRAPQVWNDEGLTAESEVVIKTRTRPPV